MRGVGDLLLAIGLILIASGLIGSLDGTFHRIVLAGGVCVIVAIWMRRRPSHRVSR